MGLVHNKCTLLIYAFYYCMYVYNVPVKPAKSN